MVGQHLRQYTSSELTWRHQVQEWQRQGFTINQRISPGGSLLHFRSDSGWEGMVDLRSWFAHVMPESSALSRHAWPVEQLEALFVNSDQPIGGLPIELAYQYLDSLGIVESAVISDSLYSCLTPHGRVWLYRLPATVTIKKLAGQFSANYLPIDISFSIGYSRISIQLLRKAQQGDVLLIGDEQNRMVAEGVVLGKFIRTEEGLMYEDDGMTCDEFIDNDSAEVQEDSASPSLLPRDKIMIKINFILQRSRLSVEELESLYQGCVLPCHLEAENNILITANDVPIAKGEMVWIEDRMGIEIKDIYQEVSHGSR